MSEARSIDVSIVSHGNSEIVSLLLKDLCLIDEINQVIITSNIPEDSPIVIPDNVKNRIFIINNEAPLGFGKNHNNAFKFCSAPYFCILNPDIRILSNPFKALTSAMDESGAVLAAPLMLNTEGEVEDSFRKWLTPSSLFKRAIGFDLGSYQMPSSIFEPDWIAGMFLFFTKTAYAGINGFDEAYFLYCEDMDISFRLRLANQKLIIVPSVAVEHDARRSSRKKIKYTVMHVRSLVRFWGKFSKYHLSKYWL